MTNTVNDYVNDAMNGHRPKISNPQTFFKVLSYISNPQVYKFASEDAQKKALNVLFYLVNDNEHMFTQQSILSPKEKLVNSVVKEFNFDQAQKIFQALYGCAPVYPASIEAMKEAARNLLHSCIEQYYRSSDNGFVEQECDGFTGFYDGNCLSLRLIATEAMSFEGDLE